MNSKSKNIVFKGIVLALALAFIVCQLLSVLLGAKQGLSSEGQSTADSAFTDVTGKLDFSDIVLNNLSSAVMENPNANHSERTVIVSLDSTSLLDEALEDSTTDVSAYSSSAEGQAAYGRIRAEQNSFLQMLRRNYVEFELVDRYDTVDNAVAIRVNTGYIPAIKSIGGVRSVVASETYLAPQTAEEDDSSSVVYNDTFVYKTGIYDSSEFLEEYSGQGTTVAILDTGLDYTHPAFQKQPEDLSKLALTRDDVENAVANKDLSASKMFARTGDALTADDLFISNKIPFAYDYADNDADVYPSYSNHGTHVAGIVGGNDDSYTDKDGNLVDEPFIGVAPNTQLVICKVFTDNLDAIALGGAETESIIAALEDCVKLGVDVINMSLGSAAGFSDTADGDDEGDYLNRVYESIRSAGISLVCAASNDYSSGYGSDYGTNLTSNPDSGTVGEPSTYAAALSVASISGQRSEYVLANGKDTIFFEQASDENSNPFDFSEQLLDGRETAEFEYVVVGGVGKAADYSRYVREALAEGPKLVLVKRGDNTFEEKVEVAMRNGAAGIIIYNNVSGKIRMSLGEIDDPIPAISITLSAGNKLIEGAVSENGVQTGTIRVDKSQTAGPFMSDFSSWGTTPDLKLKPEITAHGGEIISSVPGGYDEMSGTSMASPNMAGFIALVKSYVRDKFGWQERNTDNAVSSTQRVNQIVMSNATIAYDEDGLPYSPRKQGAGLANLSNAMKTNAYLYAGDASTDYRAKLELGDDKERKGVYDMTFKAANFGSSPLTFGLSSLFMTESLSPNGITVAEQAYMLDGSPVFRVNGQSVSSVTIEPGKEVTISLTLTLSGEEKKYLDDNFKNGMFVEGFIRLVSKTEGQNDLSIPFLAFYGDWDDAPMLDYTAFELAEFEQDASIPDEEKPKARVWATQAYSSYYHDRYVLPMGTYIYSLPDSEDPMYANMEYCAISRYDELSYDSDGEESLSDYYTSNAIEGIYAGLLRNARSVSYTLTNADTGALIKQDTVYRIRKAYAGGGSAVPAYVELKLDPEEYGLVNNGKYKMSFLFEMDSETADGTGNVFEFSFYVDYEAPTLQDVNVRFYNYEENNRPRQRIYLDLDVYDNHYAQSVILCYLDGEESMLKMATDYATPVRNPVKNGTTRVSIDITDLYDQYKDKLYVQIDDYALNRRTYQLSLTAAQKDDLPGQIEIADGDITLGVNETQTLEINYEGEADKSSFIWSSSNESVVKVKNGEIYGVKPGVAMVTVQSKDGRDTVRVTVEDREVSLSNPSISFGVIRNGNESLVKASGTIDVFPGAEYTLEIIPDPWYYPVDELNIAWSTTNDTIATVDQEGNVRTLKKGTVTIQAAICDANGRPTARVATVTLRVQDEFVVSNFTLIAYNGPGGDVVIPTDLNIYYIGEEAFEDNDNVTSVVIPKTVMEINARAFANCSALEEVYFIQKEPLPVADADLTLINRRAFYNCPNLKKVDLSNVKTITLGREAFAKNPSLEEIVGLTKVGTAYDRAFAGCSSLTSVDLSGLHRAETGVFAGCTSLTSIVTDRYTSIGEEMFAGLNSIREVTLKTGKIGKNAFRGCEMLTSVRFEGDEEFNIGEGAFENCIRLSSVDFGTATVRTIGDAAFRNTALTAISLPAGLKTLGSDIFASTGITQITVPDDLSLDTVYGSQSPFGGLQLTSILAKEDSAVYASVEGVLYNKAQTKLFLVPNAKTEGFTIPSTVTAIADNAFAGNNSVEKIEGDMLYFKDGSSTSVAAIGQIGAYAFAGSSLQSAEIPAAVGYIGAGAFKDSALTAVTFASGSNLSEIGAETFRNTAIAEIALPGSVMTIGDYALAGTDIRSFAFGGTFLGSGVFADCTALGSADLGENVERVGDRLFSGCTSLTSVEMSATESMGSYVFYNTPALASVTFADGTTAIGSFAFYSETSRSALTAVSLPDSVEQIGAYAFANCVRLSSVNTAGVLQIGDYAFYNCAALAQADLSKAESIGNYAFAYAGLTEANLPAAVSVGAAAFTDCEELTEISIPVAVTVGAEAFRGTAIGEAALPASLEQLGEGAFAYAKSLTEISVAAENERYFVQDGVLFSRIDEDSFILAAYPAGKAGAANGEGVNSYTVPDGTAALGAFSFAGLETGALGEVVLPYTLKSIGDGAFWESGVKHFVFNSINAPVLETVYRQEIVDDLEGSAELAGFYGFFYLNFGVRFADIVGFGEESDLVMSYPENGVGYDNYVYSNYFGEKRSLGILMDDDTRAALNAIEALPSAEEVSSWMNWEVTDENRAKVQAWSDTVKEARRLYGNVKDEAQLAFLGTESGEKLKAVETELRDVKNKFGIKVVLTELRYDPAGYKSTYVEGEMFDMTGLVITFVYDDGSEEIAAPGEYELVDARPLATYDQAVTIASTNEMGANGRPVQTRVRVQVTAKETEDPGNPGDPGTPPEEPGDEGTGCSGSLFAAGLPVLSAAALAAAVFALKKKRSGRS